MSNNLITVDSRESLLNDSQASDNLSLDDRVDAKLQELGGRGRFQWFAFFSIVCGMLCTNFWIYQLGYLI